MFVHKLLIFACVTVLSAVHLFVFNLFFYPSFCCLVNIPNFVVYLFVIGVAHFVVHLLLKYLFGFPTCLPGCFPTGGLLPIWLLYHMMLIHV